MRWLLSNRYFAKLWNWKHSCALWIRWQQIGNVPCYCTGDTVHRQAGRGLFFLMIPCRAVAYVMAAKASYWQNVTFICRLVAKPSCKGLYSLLQAPNMLAWLCFMIVQCEPCLTLVFLRCLPDKDKSVYEGTSTCISSWLWRISYPLNVSTCWVMKASFSVLLHVPVSSWSFCGLSTVRNANEFYF